MGEHDLDQDLRRFRSELTQARQTCLNNLSLGMQLRDRIADRLVQYLRLHVSDDEAEKVVGMGMSTNLFGTDEIDAIDELLAYLEALIADLSAGHLPAPTPSRMPIAMQRELGTLQFHPRVIEVAGQLFADGHYRQAILDTYIALVQAVKLKTGLTADNTPLMEQAFSPRNPRLRVSADPDEQQGYMRLFSGAVMAIRNPKAHQLIPQPDPARALEWLCLASALFRVLDDATPEVASAAH